MDRKLKNKLEKMLREEQRNGSISFPAKDIQTLLTHYQQLEEDLRKEKVKRELDEKAMEDQSSLNEEITSFNERLQDSEKKYREAAAVLDTIFDTIPDVLGIQDNQHNILRYNKAGYEFLNVTPEQIRGKKCYEIIGRVNMCEKCATEEAYLTLKPAKVERYFPEIDTWLDIRAYPVLDDENKVKFIIEHLRDITGTKKYEEQLKEARKRAEESDQLKSAFLANMSHEIRTPLNAILGFAELMETNHLPEDKRSKFNGFILDSGKQLLGLINDLIDISKIESGQLHVEKSTESLLNHLHEVKAIFSNHKLLKQKPGLKLEFRNMEVSSPPMIYTDPVRFKQILINLIQNALKFTEEGLVEVGWEKQEKAFLFYVKDSGIGIPLELQSKVFDRFTKLKGKDEDGTGLGLSISRGLVELLGGKIQLDSSQGEGSRFSFTIPLIPKENRENQSQED